MRPALLLFFAWMMALSVGCGDEACPPGTVDFGEGCIATDAAVDGGGDASTDGCAESRFFPDGDGDGFGDDAMAVMACEAPPMHVDVGGDCDDGDDAIHPGAAEVCDSVDQDCDIAVDEGLLGPLGDPLVVAMGVDGVINSPIDVAGYEAGYAIAYVDGTHHVRILTTNSVGTPTAIHEPVDDGVNPQDNPVIAVFGTGGASRAVVVWAEDGALRARVYPLDGTTPTDAVDVATGGSGNSRPAVLPVGDDVIIAWDRVDPMMRTSIMAVRFDPSAGAVLGGALEVFALEGLWVGFTSKVGAASVEADEPFALLAVNNRLPGDLHEVAYARRVWVEGDALARDDTPFRYEGTEARDLLDPRPYATVPDPDLAVSTGIHLVEDFESTPALHRLALTMPARGGSIAADGELEDTTFASFAIDHTSLPGGVLVLSATLTSPSELRLHPVGAGDADGGAAVLVDASMGTQTFGASISAMRPDEAAIVYSRTAAGSTYEHVFQRVGCE